jgi:tetratricopeptide (TPR) repeat protein
VLLAQGDGPGALAAYRKGLAIAEALAARDPANAKWQRDLSVSFDRIGDVLVAQGDGPGALAAYRKGLAIRQALAARDPANANWQRDLIVSNVKLGKVTGDKAHVRRALEIAEAMREQGILAPARCLDDRGLPAAAGRRVLRKRPSYL